MDHITRDHICRDLKIIFPHIILITSIVVYLTKYEGKTMVTFTITACIYLFGF